MEWLDLVDRQRWEGLQFDQCWCLQEVCPTSPRCSLRFWHGRLVEDSEAHMSDLHKTGDDVRMRELVDMHISALEVVGE